MATSRAVEYRRRVVPRRVCWALLAALVGLGVWAQWRDPGEGGHAGTASFAIGALVYGLVWGIPLWIALITAWSVNLYGTIELDQEVLRVGRERVRVRDIDRDSVERLATTAPGRRARTPDATSPARPTRPAGGAYALPLGVGAVSVTLRDGREVALGTRDRAGLVQALLRVVPTTAADPHEPVLTDDPTRTRTLFRRAPWGPATLRAATGLTRAELPGGSFVALSSPADRSGLVDGESPGPTAGHMTVLVDDRLSGRLVPATRPGGTFEVQVDEPSLAAPGLRLRRQTLSLGLVLRDDAGVLVRTPTLRGLANDLLPIVPLVRPRVDGRARPEHVALWLAASWHLRAGG